MSKQRSSQSKSTRIISVVVSIAIMVTCVLVVLQYCTPAGKRLKPTEWFGGKTEETPVTTEVIDRVVTPEIVQGNGITLTSALIASEEYSEYGISAQTESAKLLTATIDPADATNQAVDWKVGWNARATSEQRAWSSGKTVTDYMTITATSDGALTATATCKQAFGCSIVITVVSRDNSTKKASVLNDYVKALADYDANFFEPSSSKSKHLVLGDNQKYFWLAMNLTYGTGTIAPSVDEKTVSGKLKLNPDHYAFMKSNNKVTFPSTEYTLPNSILADESTWVSNGADFYLNLIGGSSYTNQRTNFIHAANASFTPYNHDLILLTVTITQRHNGKIVNTLEKTFPITVDMSAMKIAVTDVGITDGDSMIWYPNA
jgi:hypothetical protein